MSCDPKIIFSSKADDIVVKSQERITEFKDNPFSAFERLISGCSIEYSFDKNIFGKHFFPGGAVGYWGYDMKDHIEKLATLSQNNPHLPDAYWMFYDGLIVIDHLNKRHYLVGKEECIQNLERYIASDESAIPEAENFDYEIASPVSKEDYLNQIATIKEYIANGDVYEVNLAQRFHVKFKNKNFWTEFNIFKSLVETSPSPFSAFLKCGRFSVISSSPERFLHIHNREAESKPIKGTRPRRSDFFEDERMYFELMNSEKDHAENVMIVDLVRNDLGRVSETGSVKVENIFKIEKYSTVFQMVSTIKSKLDSKFGLMDTIKSCFPPGSMTGAPKIRAMGVIEELESFKRGVYSGALGYIGYDGSLDLSVVIRTLIMWDEQGYFQTGGAIVWDSEPEQEYQECLDKAKGIIEALEMLRAG